MIVVTLYCRQDTGPPFLSCNQDLKDQGNKCNLGKSVGGDKIKQRKEERLKKEESQR